MSARDHLVRRLSARSISDAQRSADALLDHIEMVERWNRHFNLVSRQDTGRLLERHVYDSLTLEPLLGTPGQLLDVGSGAGFPGLVLALVRPDIQVTLLDRSERKVRFLRQAIVELQVENAQARCEDVADIRECFDVIVTRAVMRVDQLWQWTRDCLSEEGRLLHMTGSLDHVVVDLEGGMTERHKVTVPELGRDSLITEVRLTV